jgi:endonuclease III
MPSQPREPINTRELDLDIYSGDDDLFRWFLLCFLFGKPIQSSVVLQTWHIFIEQRLDNPWAIVRTNHRKLVRLLDTGKYKRYDESTARSLHTCMQQLIREYDGSLLLMIEYSTNEDDLSKRLRGLFGVGPKVAEIFMRETEEFFARRLE